MVDALHLAEAAHARVQRRHLRRPRARIGADLHDALVAYVGVDHAATTAVVAAGAGHHAFARRRGDARRFVEDAAAHARSGYHCAMPRRRAAFARVWPPPARAIASATAPRALASPSRLDRLPRRRHLGGCQRRPEPVPPASLSRRARAGVSRQPGAALRADLSRRQPVAGVVMQIVTVAGTRLMKPLAAAPGRGGLRSARALLSRALSRSCAARARRVRERVLVCGNLLSWGFHAVAFARDEDPPRSGPPSRRPCTACGAPSGFRRATSPS